MSFGTFFYYTKVKGLYKNLTFKRINKVWRILKVLSLSIKEKFKGLIFTKVNKKREDMSFYAKGFKGLQ